MLQSIVMKRADVLNIQGDTKALVPTASLCEAKRWGLVAGVDLGGTNVKIALVAEGGKIKTRGRLSTLDYQNKEEIIEGILCCIDRLLAGFGRVKMPLCGIGIGAPGLVDSVNGIVHELPNINGWDSVPLKDIIEKRTGIATFTDNDVNLMALGEFTYGAGRGAKDVICLTLGTGVGGGIILDGKLYRGATLSAGEIGHMAIDKNGPQCSCGSFGCLERYVGNRYIVESVVEKLKKAGSDKSKIVELAGGDLDKITPEIIEQAARKGDRIAIGVWEEVGSNIGVILAGVVNLLNPERIIIGGGIAKAGELLFGPIRKAVRARAMDVPGDTVKIIPSKLWDDAGILGSEVLVRERISNGQ